MILHPAILGLLLLSAVTSVLTLFAAGHAVAIVRRWDLRSGSELQVALERRTYLISTVLSYLFGFQVVSPFLFVFTADRLCPLVTGAMCAAGVLHANGFGYPTLFLKLATFLAAGVWLALNHADNRAHDYPLVRVKYGWLLALTPLVLAEAGAQAGFFLGLKPDVITSCCGTLFSAGRPTLASDLASAPPRLAQAAFFSVLGATAAVGGLSLRARRWAGLFSALSVLSLAVGLGGIVSFVSIYVYELPTHHCPFCLLQAEYGFLGYAIYATLLGSAVTGAAVGALSCLGRAPSLAAVVPGLQARLTLASVSLLLALLALCGWAVYTSHYRP